MWNAFPGSLLFVACRAGMKRSRKARMIFVVFREKPASEPSARDVFRKRCPIRGSARVFSEKDAQSEGLQGLFSKLDDQSEGLQGMFSKLVAQSEGLQGLFSKFDAHSEGLQGMFWKKTYFQRLFWGGFFPNHPFARCFWEAFFQTTLSRVVSRRLFFKNSIPICLEMLFSLGACCSFGCEKRRGSPRLILLVWSFSKLRVSAFQPCSVLSHSRH